MDVERRNSAIKELIQRYTERVTVSKKTARAALIAEGIYNKKGVLRPEFGGPGKKSKSAA